MTRLLAIVCGLLCAVLLACLAPRLVPNEAQATEIHNVGFRTLGYWNGEKELRFDVNIWYPTIRREKDLQYGIWTLHGARNGKAAAGRFPLILVSHGTAGTRYSHHETCHALAARGFVVAALTHVHDCMHNMDHIFTWMQLSARARELSALIGVLGEDRDINASIDWNRIGILGFGSGGAAALLLGGALPNCDGWTGYCNDVLENDIYCNSWTREKMQAMCASFPLKKSLADTRIKAVAIAQPVYAMLFQGGALKHFYPPLLVLTSDADTIQLRRMDAMAIVRALPTTARLRKLRGADAGALKSACPESLAAELPELCRSVTGQQRAAIHELMHDELEMFFLKHLGDTDNISLIPPPPNLQPTAVQQDAPAKETGKGKRPAGHKAKRSGRGGP